MPTENRQPLKVLFVATSGGEGGIERYSVRLAALLRERGVEVIYACRPDSFLASHCAKAGVPAVAWRVRNSGDMTASRQMHQMLRDLSIHILHVHSRRDYVPALLGAAPLRRRGLKTVLHTHLIRPLGEPPLPAALFFRAFADRVVCVSEVVREEVIRQHRFPKSFVRVIPNGVDTTAFAPPDSPEGGVWRARQRRAWDIPQDAFVLGMVGRLDAKGQRALLEAAPQILAEHPNGRVVMVGTEGADGEAERLRAQARQLGIAERLALPGRSEDMPTTMAAFDLLVHLPADESFGLVIAEAMAAGLPVIASDIGGCREVVCDGVTGILAPLGDRDALASALGRLIGDPTAALRARRFGIAGRHRVEEEFSVAVQVARLHELYSQL